MDKTTLAAGVLAALSVSVLLAQDQPPTNPHWAFAQPKKTADPLPAGPLPPVIHFCGGGCASGKGTTLALDGNRYVARDAQGIAAAYEVVTFTRESVIIKRTDYRPVPGTATLTGKLSPDGNSIVDGKIRWAGSASPNPFQMAWGEAVNTVPGNPNDGNVQQTSSPQDQSRAMLSFLFSVIGGVGQDDGDAGSGLTGRISTLKDDVDRAWQHCMIRRDNQCHEQETLKSQLSDARSKLVSEILQLQEAHKTLDPECRNGNQDSCGKLERVDALLKKDQEFSVRDVMF
jgi:hypothetical protein